MRSASSSSTDAGAECATNRLASRAAKPTDNPDDSRCLGHMHDVRSSSPPLSPYLFAAKHFTNIAD
ncbi:hypothetical protein [Lacipirellula parvula]|uniref:Uncharacterized protein n=1 Tax=Lacipirellula parvula TaxID=2650471 RepID=A0A5K7XQ53_9BACT|nr:hypothetical protein [Lacipirellula parvula]BBO35669.1 hypothetical protein PLANPX_5281 [Lacipirellula parvula]